MSIKTRKDVYEYLKTLSSGISSPLLTITDNYHYHTVLAEDEETLDRIQEMLKDKGFLAELRDYEPVDFWANKNADNRNRTCTPKD
ncbi:MAG: 3H domain-containing protein, partial [Oscillospiraceae bacterium]|nr:3H domain-containing protein [Oscillospiraceae bacterium]